jgi:hypothetical protein
VPKDYWNKIENQKEAIEYLSKEIPITKMDDWYNVKNSDIADKGLSGNFL